MRELLIWKQLPESDVSHLVDDYFLVTDDFREMEDQGLLTMNFVGDEYVLIPTDRKSTRLNSSHGYISYAVFCLKKKKTATRHAIYKSCRHEPPAVRRAH